MEDVKVDVPRDSVPTWAGGPEAGTATQVANEALSGEPKITERQRGFLLDLIAKKDTGGEKNAGKIDLIMKCLRISEDPEEYGMSRRKASELIDWFLKRPDKPREQQAADNGIAEVDGRWCWNGVPSGRYAVENNDGELRFYNVWISRDHARASLYVLHGPSESRIPGYPAKLAILAKIKEAGIRAAAIRYGMEIGHCSNCGYRLTNRISRALGIGPVCGGRMFGDDFKLEVKSKKAELRAQGIDPNEQV